MQKLKFRFTADICFEADHIYQAFDLLSQHFGLLDDEMKSNFQFIGEMHIQPEIEREVGKNERRQIAYRICSH